MSASTDADPTCVEVAASGSHIAIQDTTLRFPKGSAFVIKSAEWEVVIQQVAAGQLDYDEIYEGSARRVGPFRFQIDSSGNVEMHHDRQSGPVVFNQGSWQVFTDGVKFRNEFTVKWIRDGSS
jgi:hypothetical protein